MTLDRQDIIYVVHNSANRHATQNKKISFDSLE